VEEERLEAEKPSGNERVEIVPLHPESGGIPKKNLKT